MSSHSKCCKETRGHLQPWGPQCTWNSQPVVTEKGHSRDNGSTGSGGDKEHPVMSTLSDSGGSRSTSPKANTQEGGLRSVEGRDKLTAHLHQPHGLAANQITHYNSGRLVYSKQLVIKPSLEMRQEHSRDGHFYRSACLQADDMYSFNISFILWNTAFTDSHIMLPVPSSGLTHTTGQDSSGH